MRIVNEPFDTQGVPQPYTAIQLDLFDYISTSIDVENGDVEVNDKIITRAELKAALPILFPDEVQDDALLLREARLRNWDWIYQDDNWAFNVEIDQGEWGRYIHHYRFMRLFWNHQQGDVPADFETHDLNATLSFKQWNTQDNMWARRDYPPESIIPQGRLIGQFNNFDQNGDGLVTFDEAWDSIQQSDINYHQWREEFDQYDANKDSVVNLQELQNYFESQGSSQQDALAKATQFLADFNKTSNQTI